MTAREAALKLITKYKGNQIIEALPGDNKFIFCLKPSDQPKDSIVMDSYYYVDNKGNIGPYAYGLHMDEWRKGMKNQIDLKEIL